MSDLEMDIRATNGLTETPKATNQGDGVSEKDPLKCESCEFITRDKLLLASHTKMHNFAEKQKQKFTPVLCEQCSSIFSSKYALKDHILTMHDKAKQFKCNQCDFSAVKNYGLQLHIKSKHLNIKEHKCDKCTYSSDRSANLRLHKKSIHGDNMIFPCPKCEFTASDLRSIKSHDSVVHGEGDRGTYKCQCCSNFATRSWCILERHERVVHQNVLRCQHCQFETGSRYVLKDHLTTDHGQKKEETKCDYYDYVVDNKAFLKNHVKAKHQGVKFDGGQPCLRKTNGEHKIIHCGQCGSKFANNNNLKMHIAAVHEKVKNYKCNQCEYSAAQKISLKMHVRSKHLNIKDYKCDKCNYSSVLATNLRNHVKRVHEGVKVPNTKMKECYNCQKCEFATTHKDSLKRHEWNQHKNIKDYKCHQCDYSAAQKHQLQTHTNSKHNHIKNYQCVKCNYSTVNSGNLRKHVKTVHDNIKDFQCQLCAYKSVAKNQLAKHMRAVHYKGKRLNSAAAATKLIVKEERSYESFEQIDEDMFELNPSMEDKTKVYKNDELNNDKQSDDIMVHEEELFILGGDFRQISKHPFQSNLTWKSEAELSNVVSTIGLNSDVMMSPNPAETVWKDFMLGEIFIEIDGVRENNDVGNDVAISGNTSSKSGMFLDAKGATVHEVAFESLYIGVEMEETEVVLGTEDSLQSFL